MAGFTVSKEEELAALCGTYSEQGTCRCEDALLPMPVEHICCKPSPLRQVNSGRQEIAPPPKSKGGSQRHNLEINRTHSDRIYLMQAFPYNTHKQTTQDIHRV
jgi:hypothetical protein